MGSGCGGFEVTMGCQRDVAKRIVEKKGDYVFCLKGNQTSLHDEVKYFFDECFSAKLLLRGCRERPRADRDAALLGR